MHSSTSTAQVGPGRQAIELAGVLALALLIFSYGARASLDDLLIYLRYVANILGGNGPVYNAGEASAGATSFGWLAVMSVVARLFGNAELVWKGTGVAFILIGLLLFAWRLRPLPAVSALCILLFTLLDPFAIRWFGSGMENGLVYAGVAACLLAFENFLQSPDRARAALVCAASAVLPFVRPEFLALSGIVSLFVAFSNKRAFFWIVACQAVAIAVVAVLGAGTAYAWTQVVDDEPEEEAGGPTTTGPTAPATTTTAAPTTTTARSESTSPLSCGSRPRGWTAARW